MLQTLINDIYIYIYLYLSLFRSLTAQPSPVRGRYPVLEFVPEGGGLDVD